MFSRLWFTRLGHFTVRRRRLVLALSGVLVLLAAVLGTGVFARLEAGGFEDPSSESVRAAEAVEDDFHTGQPNVVLLVDVADGDVDSAASSAAGAAVLGSSSGTRPLPSRSRTGRSATRRRFDPPTVQRHSCSPGWVATRPSRSRSPRTLIDEVSQLGGDAVVSAAGRTAGQRRCDHHHRRGPGPGRVDRGSDHTAVVGAGVRRADRRRPAAAGGSRRRARHLPHPVRHHAVHRRVHLLDQPGHRAGAGTRDRLLAVHRVAVPRGAGPSTTGGVRQGRSGATSRPPSWRTMQTAGRTVAFSALTVAVSLAALFVFPMFFLRSFAFAGIGVTIVAMTASLFTLPATLAWLGRRVDRFQLGRSRSGARARQADPSMGFWYRTAMFSQRHAVAVAVAVVAFLLLLGVPFARRSVRDPRRAGPAGGRPGPSGHRTPAQRLRFQRG